MMDYMNMFKDAGVDNIKDYLVMVPDDRKDAINFLHEFIQKCLPDSKPFFAYNMLGYGKFKYTNYKKEAIDWPIVALASQKNYISIYVCAVDGEEYLAEKYKNELGKASVGKSCIRFKKIDDICI